MRQWNDLSIGEKAEMMRVAVSNGITTLPEIKAKYNEFASGGSVDRHPEGIKEHKSRWAWRNPYSHKLDEERKKSLTGKMKSQMAIESNFNNPTARRMTGYDNKSYEWPDEYEYEENGIVHPLRGNVYVSSYDNLVTPQIQEVNGNLEFVEEPWDVENAHRSYKQSLKFNTPEEAEYFGKHYKEVAPMMNRNHYPGGGYLDVAKRHIRQNEGFVSKPMKGGGRRIYTYDNAAIPEEPNMYPNVGYKPSSSIKKRISNWEGKAMTDYTYDPNLGRIVAPNAPFETVARDFTNVIPRNIRDKVLSNQGLADYLFSYAYNVGPGNFQKRVVPALRRYYEGTGSAADIANSMWATGDRKKHLPGLRKRRAVERNGVRAALGLAPVQYTPADFGFAPKQRVQAPQIASIEIPSIEDTFLSTDFTPSNPDAFFSPFTAYERPTIEIPVEEPLVNDAALYAEALKKEEEAERKQRGLDAFGMLLSRSNDNPSSYNPNNNSMLGAVGVLADNSNPYDYTSGYFAGGGPLGKFTQGLRRKVNRQVIEAGMTPEQKALSRSYRVYSNYNEAKDAPFSIGRTNLHNELRSLKDKVWDKIPAGVSNCTLTATQWVDPNNPIKSASSIVNNPEQYGYTPISEQEASIGNLLITKVPGEEIYHTMMIDGFAPSDGVYSKDGVLYPYKEGDITLSYSTGGHEPWHLRKKIPMTYYDANSDGHTEKYYYRYNNAK